jgi:hypothetical protein
MTRKDYVLIAAALKDARPIPKHELYALDHNERLCADTYRNVARSIADALAKDNPRFDRERFLTACGVQS